MAKINGFELKNIVNFRGHEGEDLIQGNVYYNGKKIGYYSQDAWGGMDIFDIDYNLPKELKEKIEKITDNYVGGKLFKKMDDLYSKKYNLNFNYEKIGYEYLFMDLLQLLEHQKIYQKYSKKWGKGTIYIVYKDIFTMNITCLKEKATGTYFEYNSLEDFDITGEKEL